MKQMRGFSLIELMIAVVIIGVIASIAYPAYQGQIVMTKRAEAKAALTAFANAMQGNFSLNYTYLGLAVGGANTGAPAASVFPNRSPVLGGNKNYDLVITAATATTFTLSAIPTFTDSECGTLTLTESGVGGPAGCW